MWARQPDRGGPRPRRGSLVRPSRHGGSLELAEPGVLLAFELNAVELGILAARGQELVVATALDDPPMVEDEDHVGLPYR